MSKNRTAARVPKLTTRQQEVILKDLPREKQELKEMLDNVIAWGGLVVWDPKKQILWNSFESVKLNGPFVQLTLSAGISAEY